MARKSCFSKRGDDIHCVLDQQHMSGLYSASSMKQQTCRTSHWQTYHIQM